MVISKPHIPEAFVTPVTVESLQTCQDHQSPLHHLESESYTDRLPASRHCWVLGQRSESSTALGGVRAAPGSPPQQVSQPANRKGPGGGPVQLLRSRGQEILGVRTNDGSGVLVPPSQFLGLIRFPLSLPSSLPQSLCSCVIKLLTVS